MILNLSIPGWLAGLAVGFIVGGVYFLSIKGQVDYVLKKQGPLWLAPAALYGRMMFAAVILILLAVFFRDDRTRLLAILIAGMVGAGVGRVLVSRMVKREQSDSSDEQRQHKDT